MKSLTLHALVAAAVCLTACRTSSGTSGAAKGPSGVSIDPNSKIAEIDGQVITYGQLENDKESGTKLRQAEVKALTDLYDARRGVVEELISKRLLEGEAKSKGKTLEQWFQQDYMS